MKKVFLLEKKKNSIFHGRFWRWHFFLGSIISVWISAQTGVDNEINLKSTTKSQFDLLSTHKQTVFDLPVHTILIITGYNAAVISFLVSNFQTWPVMSQWCFTLCERQTTFCFITAACVNFIEVQQQIFVLCNRSFKNLPPINVLNLNMLTAVYFVSQLLPPASSLN